MRTSRSATAAVVAGAAGVVVVMSVTVPSAGVGARRPTACTWRSTRRGTAGASGARGHPGERPTRARRGRPPPPDTVRSVTMLASRRLLFRRLRGPELVAVDGVFAAALAALCVYAATEDPLGPEGVREPAWVSVLAGLLVVAPVEMGRA